MRLLLLSTFCFLSVLTSIGQTITVAKFESQVISNFDGDKEITKKSLANSFGIRINDTTGITDIFEKNGVGDFVKVTNVDDSEDSKLYVIEGPFIEDTATSIYFKLIKGEGDDLQEKMLQLDFIDEGDGEGQSADCLEFYKELECDIPERDNNFGLDTNLVATDEIVFVYDYNNSIPKRGFYKITNPSGGTLLLERANFNKEVLSDDDNVRFIVQNVNRFLYNVEIADTIADLVSNPPELLNRFFLGDTSLLDGLMDLVPEPVGSQSFEYESAEGLLKSIRCFSSSYQQLKHASLKVFDPCYEFPCCQEIDFSKFSSSLARIKAYEAIVQKDLESLQKAENDCSKNLKLKSFIEADILRIENHIEMLNSRIDKKTKEELMISRSIDSMKERVFQLEQEVFSTSKNDSLAKLALIKRLEQEILKESNELSFVTASRIVLDTKADDFRVLQIDKVAAKDSILFNISVSCDNADQELINALEVSKAFLDNLPSEEELIELVKFVNQITIGNNSYSTDYIDLDGHILELTLSISPKDTLIKEIKGESVSTIEITSIPILGKPLVSFSSGSFVSLTGRIQNKTYQWHPTTGVNNVISDSTYTLEEQGFSPKPLGFCAFANVQKKKSQSFGIGFSAGVGLTLEETPRVGYLGGVSLYFGDTRQLSITAGAIGMQIDRLTKNFEQLRDNQTIFKNDQTTLEYYKQFQVGTFLAITYTPFKTYKK